MKLADAIGRLEAAVHTAAAPAAGLAELKAALAATTQVQSFIAATRSTLLTAINEHPAAFPEGAIADTSGCSLGAASKETERSRTLGDANAIADALSDGDITTGHVDALTRTLRDLDDDARDTLLDDDQTLADQAASGSVNEFAAYLRRRKKALETTADAEERLDRQRRATRVSTWTDDDGMWNLRGRFDPALGKDLARRLAAATKAKFGDELPDTAPSEPVERAKHLEALALAELILGTAASPAGSGPPVVVIDGTQGDGAGGPVIDWGLPVELPRSVLLELFADDSVDPEVVVVANGIVLYAPGRLDLGRTTRLANAAQRRALRGLYATCAIPGCSVHYDRCKLHHIVWWRNGGNTDLINLLPVCQHHHTLIHRDGWLISLGPNRQLTIRLPDGQIMTTGPPDRTAA